MGRINGKTLRGLPFSATTASLTMTPFGAPLPSLQAALHLNELVRALPWQHEVQRALQHHALN